MFEDTRSRLAGYSDVLLKRDWLPFRYRLAGLREKDALVMLFMYVYFLIYDECIT